MGFDWKTLVDLATTLAQQAQISANSEAYQRSALSRLYFGAYGHARNYAIAYLQFIPRNAAEDHGRLRQHLKSKRRKGDADRLEQLRIWRNDADYADDLSSLDLTATVTIATALAHAVFNSLVPPKAAPP
jgi:hypothetical protein